MTQRRDVVTNLPANLETAAARLQLEVESAGVVALWLNDSPWEAEERVRRLRREAPQRAILVLVPDRADVVLAAIQAGAGGCLHHGASPAEIAEAMDHLRLGAAPLSPRLARHVLAALRPPSPDIAESYRLSQREREVLTLLANGHSYASIAKALHIGLSTVQAHVRNLYRKLSVSSKAEAAALAVRHQLLP